MYSNSQSLKKQHGQSLVEVLVVLLITAVMLVSLILVILSSLKNAQFAQNQTRATKFAQDTIDKIRVLRDSNKNGTLSPPPFCFNELWNGTGSFSCGGTICYYQITPTGDVLLRVALANSKENLGEGFSREILVTQAANTSTNTEIKLIVQISWTDSSGVHNSNLETVLTKPSYDCIP